MSIRDAGELLQVLKDWKEAGLELRRDSHPAVGTGSEAHALLMRLFKEQEAQAMATPATPSDSPENAEELLNWCETQMALLAERVRQGGAAAANHDLLIHQIGRKADALARIFCPPDLILRLPVVPVTPPNIYDHHKTLTVLHAVAQWCRGQNGDAPKQWQTGVRKILFLAANPSNTGRLRLDKEARELAEGLKRSNHRDRFEFVPKFAVSAADLRRSLLDHSPHIVHFSGHGAGANGIVTEDDQGKAYLVPNDALTGLFKLCASHVECVVLNACYSEVQADAIAKEIPFVIGMNASVSDSAALEFAIGFYDGLGAGRSVEEAFGFGCNAIELKGIAENLTPVLKRKM